MNDEEEYYLHAKNGLMYDKELNGDKIILPKIFS